MTSISAPRPRSAQKSGISWVWRIPPIIGDLRAEADDRRFRALTHDPELLNAPKRRS
jgi:hypothetical protein